MKFCTKIIAILLFVIMGYTILFLYNNLQNQQQQSDHNILALTDSIEYYKAKNGNIVAEKTILEGNIETLKLANAELAQTIEDMKIHKPEQVVYIQGEVVNELHDTIWEVKTDTVYIEKSFKFLNKYRDLEGVVYLDKQTLGLNITKDVMYFDYTLAIKDGKVYVTSDNPYVNYNQIAGITEIHNKKKWSIGIGPSVGVGYDIANHKIAPYVGVGVNLNYNLFQWGNK